MVLCPASSTRARPTSWGTWPPQVMPSLVASSAMASYSARVRPGWIFRKSQPAAAWLRTMRRAWLGEDTELPLKLGPPRYKVGPRISPRLILSRNSNWPGAPSMPRTVVTPLARYRNSKSSRFWSILVAPGIWPCISARPGTRNFPVPSMRLTCERNKSLEMETILSPMTKTLAFSIGPLPSIGRTVTFTNRVVSSTKGFCSKSSAKIIGVLAKKNATTKRILKNWFIVYYPSQEIRIFGRSSTARRQRCARGGCSVPATSPGLHRADRRCP